MHTHEKSAPPDSHGAPAATASQSAPTAPDSQDAPAALHQARTLPVRVLGLDVTGTPGPRKPLTLAVCDLAQGEGSASDSDTAGAPPVLTLHELRELHTLDDVDRLFGGQFDAGFTVGHMPPDAGWVLGIDAALAQPLELVEQLDWPRDWAGYAALCGAMDRATFRDLLRGVSAARPAGQKYLYRACCRRAGAASPMNTVRPPVALMFHAVAPRLVAHAVHVPLLRPVPHANRVALETYPGWLARHLIGRAPYKGGDATDRATRREVRTHLLRNLAGLGKLAESTSAAGPTNPISLSSPLPGPLPGPLSGLTVRWNADHAARMLDDPEADLLDALLCAVLAAVSTLRPCYGLPSPAAPPHGVTAAQLDVEGWIAGLPQEE